MAKWVVRRGLRGAIESDAEFCVEHQPLITNTGVRTITDCIQSMLKLGEWISGNGARRSIHLGAAIVGYIELSELHP